jgi:hypothetical protein
MHNSLEIQIAITSFFFVPNESGEKRRGSFDKTRPSRRTVI